MRNIFERLSDDRLVAEIVWMPILRSDNRTSAERRVRNLVDPRVSHFWDSGKLTGDAWRHVIGRQDTAWDVYFLYGADAQWDTQPPRSDLWLPELHGATSARLELKVRQLLEEIQ